MISGCKLVVFRDKRKSYLLQWNNEIPQQPATECGIIAKYNAKKTIEIQGEKV